MQNNFLQHVCYSRKFESKMRKISLFQSKAEFFLYMIDCKLIARGITTQVDFSKFDVQREKMILFYHEEIWDEEERFRLRYCLRFLMAFKRQGENTALSSRYNAVMSLSAIFRRFKIALAYLRNSLVIDVDRVNSRFLVFLYFLTQSKDVFISKSSNMLKKRRILRNLFFIFIFAQERLLYFFGLTRDNPILARRSIKLRSEDLRLSLSIFPKGLFLLFYSPYKVMYQFGSSKITLSKYKTFLQRLEYSVDLIRRPLFKTLLAHTVNRSAFKMIEAERNCRFFNSLKEKNQKDVFLKIQQLLIKLRFDSCVNKQFWKFAGKSSSKLKGRRLYLLPKLGFSQWLNVTNASSLFLRQYKQQIRQSKFSIYSIYSQSPRRVYVMFGNILRRCIRNLSLFESKAKFLYSKYGRRPSFFASVVNFRLLLKRYYRFLNVKGNLFIRNIISYFGFSSFLNRVFLTFKNLTSKLLMFNMSLTVPEYNNYEQTDPLVAFSSFKFLRKYKRISEGVRLKLITAHVFTSGVSKKIYFSPQKVTFLRQLNSSVIFPVIVQFVINNESFLRSSRTYIGRLFRNFGSLRSLTVFVQTGFFLNQKFLKFFFDLLTNYISILSLIQGVSVRVARIATDEFYFFHHYIFQGAFLSGLNSDLDNFLDFLSSAYKSSLAEQFGLLFSSLSISITKPVLVKLRYIRRTDAQIKIIGQHNLRNLESLKDAVKKLATFLKRVNEKKHENSSLLYNSNVYSNRFVSSKIKVSLRQEKKSSDIYAYSNLVKSRIKQYFSSVFWRSSFFGSIYRSKRFFRKNVRKLFFRRKVRRFLINVLFLNKFVKERRLMQSYYGFARRGMRVSRFHKLSSPFFLRLRLKRFVLFELQPQVKRVTNRFSFTMLSYGLSAALSKFVSLSQDSIESFLVFGHTKIPGFTAGRLLSHYIGNITCEIIKFRNIRNIELVLYWLTFLKMSYFLTFLRFVELSKIIGNLFNNMVEYILILLVFFRRKHLLFLREFALHINEFLDMFWFLREIKQFFLIHMSFTNSNKFIQKRIFGSLLSFTLIKQSQFLRPFATAKSVVKKLSILHYKTNKNLRTFKFFFFPERFLFSGVNDSLFKVFQYLLVSTSVVAHKFMTVSSMSFSQFLNIYLACGWLQFVPTAANEKIWPFFLMNSDLNFDSFPVSLYPHFEFLSVQHLFYPSLPVVTTEVAFSIFSPLFSVGFFTFFYATIRNMFATYSHFRFSSMSKRFKKRRKWKGKVENVNKRFFLSSKYVGFMGAYKRRPTYASFFHQKRLGAKIHRIIWNRTVRMKYTAEELRMQRRRIRFKITQVNVPTQSTSTSKVRQRFKLAGIKRFKIENKDRLMKDRVLNLKYLGKIKGRASYLCRLPQEEYRLFSYFKNGDVRSSIKARSLRIIDVLGQPNIFSGKLAFEIRGIKLLYTLDQVVNRMYSRHGRVLKHKQVFNLALKKKWSLQILNSNLNNYFDKLFVKNVRMQAVLLNLKFQRFFRLFLVLSTQLVPGSGGLNICDKTSGEDLHVVVADWDVSFFEFIFTCRYYDMITNAVNEKHVKWLCNYFSEFLFYDNDDVCFGNSLVGWDDAFFLGFKDDVSVLPGVFFDVDNWLLENFNFINFEVAAVDLDQTVAVSPTELFIENRSGEEILDIGGNFEDQFLLPFSFSSSEFLKFYMHVRSYKFVNNLSNFVVPMDLLEGRFSQSFLCFLFNRQFIYMIRDTVSKVSYLLLSELFVVFLHKFLFSIIEKLLGLGSKVYQNLVLHELLDFVNYLCLENLKNVLIEKQIVSMLANFFKTSDFVSVKKGVKFDLRHVVFSNILYNYKRIVALAKASIVNNNNNLISRARVIYQISKLNRKMGVIRKGPLLLVNSLVSTTSSDKKFRFVKFFQDYRKKLTKARSHLMFPGNGLLRHSLKQYLRRHKRRFVYQKFLQFMLDRKLEVSNNRQLNFLRGYVLLKGRGLFSRFKSCNEHKAVRFDAPIPIKKRFKKRRKVAYFYSQVQRNPYEVYPRRILHNIRAKRAYLNRRHFFIKTRFPLVLKKKMFVDFFVSPRFFNFKRGVVHMYFSHVNLDLTLKNKTGLFFKLNRFLEFLIRLAFRVKAGLKQTVTTSANLVGSLFCKNFMEDRSFSFLFMLYRRVKSLMLNFMLKLGDSFVKNVRMDSCKRLVLNFSNSRIRFGFFYNYLSTKFFKIFILRYFFFGDYMRARLQFITRYLWFRVIPLNTFVLNPRVFIIITKLRNNFFITGIDLFGRVLYKTSPGMVKFTGTDRMSKYAWFETSVDFFEGFVEFFRYFLKGRKRKRESFVRWRILRTYGDRLHGMKRVLGAFFDSRKLDFWKSLKKMKKRRAKQKLRLRRFFVISKGISDFNLRIFRKGMIDQRFTVSKFFSGAVNYPMKSFSLCRIKKVRRI